MRPDLLMSRTMKARYFSGKFVWEIGQKGIDSWCRKSLLIARGMLEEGMRIRVGDGDQIKVWEDRWLPNNKDGRIRSKRNPESKIQRGILPTNVVMREKCEKGGPGYRCCGESVETLKHMFFMCNNARAIWKAAPLSWKGLEVFNKSFWHWWEELGEAMGRVNGKEHIALTVIILWQIWKAGNGKQFNNKCIDPRIVVDKAVLEWNEHQLAQEAGTVEEGNSAGKMGANRCWVKPQDNWIKINTDAALNMKRGKAGWGIVARDRHGRVIRSWACPTTSCADAKVEEALVIREAMKLARREG
nr:uncharacterized protein LOC113712542 [Coffea arabica]